ncbi:caspase family protein [Ensifer soli]|uniref:caspase family protein n=1 Tax=Ciceribacter sp. sgz301302 TaxID=3342379 RepID=UPI0035BB8962
MMPGPFSLTPRRLIAALMLACALLAGPLRAEAAARVALVFGLADYRTVTPLKNTANDARAIAATLTALGFDTTVALDATLDAMVTAVNTFSEQAETADVALVYYAGHGVELDGENYLLPVDLAIDAPSEIGARALSLKRLLAAVDRARRLRIVILDSCRNNPFADGPVDAAPAALPAGAIDRLRGGGLAAPSPDRGMMVVYAAEDGKVALDGKGSHSPFAQALLDLMPKKDVEIGLLFRQVRDAVMRETENRQQPHFYGSLSGVPFFLAGGDQPLPDGKDKAVAWQKLAPDQSVQLAALAGDGDTRAMIGLGYMALSPDTARYAPAEAFRHFSTAAERGDAEAMFELAKLYETGVGTTQDVAEALRLFRASADLGFPDAINDLGVLTYQGMAGLPSDPQAAIALFLKAADLRHPQAMFNVAALIDDGMIPGKGPGDAAGYLYLALRSGVEAVLNLLETRPTMFSAATRKALQAILAEKKFYAGAIDGAFGPGTQRSLQVAFGRAPS